MAFHWSRDCLFSRLFRLTATKRRRLLITARSPSNANELQLHRASNIESFSMLWRQLEGWQPSFIISLVVTKLGGLSFRQWLWVLFGDEAITVPWSVGDYYNTLGRRQFYCLFNSLSGLTTKKASRQSVPAPLWGELMYYRKFPLQRASNAQMLPWHDVIMRNSNIWLPLFHSLTSTVYWCIASKLKSPVKFLLNEQYIFVGGNISFLCVLSCSSEEA